MLNNKLINLIKALLREALLFQSPTDKILSNFFRENKTLESNDRYIVAETIYSVIRNYYKITQVVGSDNYLLIIGITLVKILKLDEKMLQKVSNIDFHHLAKLDFSEDLLSTTELPNWIIEKLLNHFNKEEIADIALSMQQQAPLDLRVNLIKTDRNKVLKQLEQEKVLPQITPYSPFGIRLTNKISLAKHQLFLQGLIEVQDESSQLSGMLLSPRRGEMVVDFCAGSGGKTLHIATLMHNSGRVYAFDVSERRLNNLAPRLKRSGLSNIYPQLIINENDNKIKRLQGKIDRVFVDAPCSGLGTLRRNPELKFRQNIVGISELCQKQLSILTSASKLLKSGGSLVYATCSILYEENQGIINTFLAQNAGFKLIPAQQVFSKLKIPLVFIDNNYLFLLPNIHKTDGFFAALIQKI